MTLTYTQHMLTVSDYETSRHPADLVRDVEASVRQVLALGATGSQDDIVTGWLARMPGYDVHTEDGRRWIPWQPGTPVPEHADQLACRARRQS